MYLKLFKIIIIFIFVYTWFNSLIFAKIQHGPVFGISYFPLGYGISRLPYYDNASGTATTEPDGTVFKSAEKLSFYAGYFFDILQTDLSYNYSEITNQHFRDKVNHLSNPDGKKKTAQFRFGRRFSDPGFSSYYWFYLGMKWMKLESSYLHLNNSGTGYLAGFEGMNSFGVNSSFEYVISYNIFAGVYESQKFSSDIEFSNLKKSNSVTAGIDLGFGIQYEPQNIILMIKLSSDVDHIAYKAKLSGSDTSFMCSSIGFYAGLSIMYIIPNFKYNK